MCRPRPDRRQVLLKGSRRSRRFDLGSYRDHSGVRMASAERTGGILRLALVGCRQAMVRFRLFLAVLVLCSALPVGAADDGFESLFDGSTLDGWILLNKRGVGYTVEDGTIACHRNSGGNLLSASEYDNFVLRFEFKLEPGSNNGLCIRCPL